MFNQKSLILQTNNKRSLIVGVIRYMYTTTTNNNNSNNNRNDNDSSDDNDSNNNSKGRSILDEKKNTIDYRKEIMTSYHDMLKEITPQNVSNNHHTEVNIIEGDLMDKHHIVKNNPTRFIGNLKNIEIDKQDNDSHHRNNHDDHDADDIIIDRPQKEHNMNQKRVSRKPRDPLTIPIEQEDTKLRLFHPITGIYGLPVRSLPPKLNLFFEAVTNPGGPKMKIFLEENPNVSFQDMYSLHGRIPDFRKMVIEKEDIEPRVYWAFSYLRLPSITPTVDTTLLITSLSKASSIANLTYKTLIYFISEKQLNLEFKFESNEIIFDVNHLYSSHIPHFDLTRPIQIQKNYSTNLYAHLRIKQSEHEERLKSQGINFIPSKFHLKQMKSRQARDAEIDRVLNGLDFDNMNNNVIDSNNSNSNSQDIIDNSIDNNNNNNTNNSIDNNINENSSLLQRIYQYFTSKR
ncbi:hypothetical protein CYY_005704 [Polysphondylium violaceum]|uniref:Uncharacterized protein n=1 Tax=Polysphondylium violaceum TaxID=133409 RepID=A0A8J4V3X0_9MYCE|nr:hypothetical protein CYY_005704 [Polysphondylium violaceum]